MSVCLDWCYKPTPHTKYPVKWALVLSSYFCPGSENKVKERPRVPFSYQTPKVDMTQRSLVRLYLIV